MMFLDAPLRLALVVGVLASTYASLHASLLPALAVLLAWGVLIPRALDDHPDRGNTFDTELLLVVAVALRTLLVLDRYGVPSGDFAWLAVVGVAVVYTRRAGESASAATATKTRAHAIASVSSLLFFVLLLVFDIPSASTMRGILLVAEALAWSMLMGAPGASAPTLALYLQATALLVESEQLALRLVVLGILFVMSAVRDSLAPGVVVKLGDLLRRVQDVVRALLTSSLPYQMVVLASATVLLQAMTQAWFTTHVTFPSLLRKQCDALLQVVSVVKIGYEFTSDPDFQRTLLPVLPELAQVRAIIYRSVFAAFKPLTDCSNGKRTTFTPSQDVVALVFFVPIAVTAMGVLLQVFSGGGGAYVRSPVFWAVATIAGLTFTVVTQLTSDAPVMLWFFLFDGSNSDRRYTDAGQYALVASLVFTAACLALSVLTSWASRPVSTGVLTGPLKRLAGYIVSPPVLTLGATGVTLALAITLGSPISGFEVYKKPTGAPAWLVSTPVDKAAALGASSLVDLMAKNGGRIVYIGIALTTYALQKMGTWGCLCLDDIIDVFSPVGDFFSSWGRRRLLEHKLDSTSYGMRAVAVPRRRLFGSGCSTTEVCVSDIVKTIVEELTELATKGFEVALNVAAKAIRVLVPFAGELDAVLDELRKLDDLVDFDLLALPAVSLHMQTAMLGLDFGRITTFSMPSLPAASFAVSFVLLVLLALGYAYALGLLEPLAVSTWMSIELIVLGAVVALFSAIIVFVYGLRTQLQLEGYDVRFELNANVYMYGISVMLGVASLLLAAAASGSGATVQLAQSVGARGAVLVGKKERAPLLVHCS